MTAARPDPRTVVCPVTFCRAAVGESCVAWKDGTSRIPHIARMNAADNAAKDASKEASKDDAALESEAE